jgi:VanZ family protein
MKKVKKIFFFWGPVIFWCGLIFFFSSIPNLKTVANPLWDEVIRSIIHLLIFGLLFLLFYRALNAFQEKKKFTLPLVFSLFYSLSDEIHQSFVPTRTFQIRDLGVDSLGIFLGFYLIWKLLPRVPKKLNLWAKKLALI